MNEAAQRFFAVALLAAETNEFVLNPWGWTVMISSITAVILLLAYCLTKVMSLPPVEQESISGPLDYDTEEEKLD